MKSRGTIRLIVFARDVFPTNRVDVESLFGRELVGRGHEIDVVMQASSSATAPGLHDWHGRRAWVGRAVDTPGATNRVRHLLAGFAHDLRSLRLARRDHYDALQVRDKFVMAVPALLIARLRGLKFFFWLSFPYPESDIQRAADGQTRHVRLTALRGKLIGWLLYKVILPRSDHVFVQSEAMKAGIAAQGIDPTRMTAVPMGAEVYRLECKSSWAISGGRVLLGYIGTLGPERRPEIFVDLLVQLRAAGVPAEMLLIGDGETREERTQLEAVIRARGVERFVTITGFLPRPRALALLLDVDIALSPIYPNAVLNVGSPTKLMEYLALRIPVVANTQQEQRIVMRECRAGVCVPWGARHFARGVRWLLSRSAAEREAMTFAGREWVSRHRNYAAIADGVEAAYYAALGMPSLPADHLTFERTHTDL